MSTRHSAAPGHFATSSARPGVVFFKSLLTTLLSVFLFQYGNAQFLKSVVYDFDGFDLGQTTLPEGDYSYGDLSYQVAANPLAASGQLGDRVLRLDVTWNAGYAAFGRGIGRFIDLDRTKDQLHFFFYNPTANGQSANIEAVIADDDNQTGSYESGSDDSWRQSVTITGQNGWQLISLPLSSFSDNNSGGNGQFDISFQGGQLLLVELKFSKPSGASSAAAFYVDMISFSENGLPQGSTALQLPPSQAGDHCLLGAHQDQNPGEYYKIPDYFHSLFPPSTKKKIRYVNTYMQWATNGSSVPHMLPGNGYQTLLNNGYVPIITWEPSFSGFSLSDAAQPDLDEIIAGDFDSYIDAFANQLKTYSDTVIIRLMHEFDGDWYPWCIANNGQDPQKFVNAFRHIVDRVKQKGATRIKWMWCPNNDFTPQASWNRVVSAYPGDNYVDIVATDVYNSHYPPALPWWRSFRWQFAEIYYNLTRNFPAKPFFICEVASRERQSGEPAGSQDKAGWIAAMDRDLQSYFRLTRALIFFSEDKSEQWSVNSSAGALQGLKDNIWNDDYYFFPLTTGHSEMRVPTLVLSPNPASDRISVFLSNNERIERLRIFDMAGRTVIDERDIDNSIDVSHLPKGVYQVLVGNMVVLQGRLVVR